MKSPLVFKPEGGVVLSQASESKNSVQGGYFGFGRCAVNCRGVPHTLALWWGAT